MASAAGGRAAARKVTYLPRYLTSLLSDVTNDVVTLGLRYPYMLKLSPISALMSATISVYPDIVSDISSYISYDIRDVPDIVGGKNRVSLKIGPDIRVLTLISEFKTRYRRWQEPDILYRVPDIGVFSTISDPILRYRIRYRSFLLLYRRSLRYRSFVPISEFALTSVPILEVMTSISEHLRYRYSETGFYSLRCSSKRSAQ